MSKKLTLSDAQLLAKKFDGYCISQEYINCDLPLQWECSKGHQWDALYHHIKRNLWCPYCSGRARKWRTIEDLQKLAEERGGKCLSKKYTRTVEKYSWQCNNKHTWDALLSNILKGSWCPYCYTYISEQKCRYILETLTNHPFPKVHIMDKKGRIELDGYSKQLGIAFEYQGQQHYEMHPVWSPDLAKRKRLDATKREYCQINSIQLVEVPYYCNTSDKRLLAFISQQLHADTPTSFNMNDFYKTRSEIQKLRTIAKERGGECTATEYISDKKKVPWKCSEGHKWEATPTSIKRGSWCPKCSRKKRGYDKPGVNNRKRKYDHDIIYKELQSQDRKTVARRYGCSRRTIIRILQEGEKS